MDPDDRRRILDYLRERGRELSTDLNLVGECALHAVELSQSATPRQFVYAREDVGVWAARAAHLANQILAIRALVAFLEQDQAVLVKAYTQGWDDGYVREWRLDERYPESQRCTSAASSLPLASG